MKYFLGALALCCFLAAIWFGVLAMQGEALHLVSTVVMVIAGMCFALISRVGE